MKLVLHELQDLQVIKENLQIVKNQYYGCLVIYNLSLPFIVVVRTGNNELGCIIFLLPTELKEEILNVNLIHLFSRINTEMCFW